ncbi:MAG: hypothetical protein ABI821_17950 [Pseudomonadota bacterium]
MKSARVMAVIGALLPVFAWAKTGIGRIEIQAGDSAARTIEAPDLARRFSIWNGPGTSSDRTSAHTLADWTRGIVELPAGLAVANVTIFCGDQRAALAPCHLVKYACDAQRKRGYIYLPGPAEEGYELNVRHVLRGVEGNWLRSTPEWDALLTDGL